MKLRKIFTVACLCAAAVMSAQAPQKCEISLTIADAEGGDVVPPAVSSRLDTKLKTMMSRVGVAGTEGSQFFITGRFDTGFSERTSGPTPLEYVNTTLTLFMGDAEGKKIFSSLTLDLKGTGASVEQAYTKAINSININRPDFKNFVEEGKNKIVEYYNNNYPAIITKARTAMNQRNYDEALYYAAQIPECSTGFPEAQSVIESAYTARVNYEAANALTQAQGAWAADPTEAGAREAYKYINQIDPSSPSYAAAQALGQKIEKTVKEQWNFENVQKYKDQLALQKQREANRASLEKARINAVRDVAVAYAKSRPRTVVYSYHRWY